MKNAIQLANRFREVLLHGRWVANTNYMDQLLSISWQQAHQKIGSLNTIVALTYHINYYLDGILPVFRGDDLDIQDKYSFDHEHIKTEEDWENLLREMWSNAEQFADHIEQLADEQLDDIFVQEKYGTLRRNIEGVIEHCYYHLGQISLIRKLIMES